jgi:hypothetical protein
MRTVRRAVDAGVNVKLEGYYALPIVCFSIGKSKKVVVRPEYRDGESDPVEPS